MTTDLHIQAPRFSSLIGQRQKTTVISSGTPLKSLVLHQGLIWCNMCKASLAIGQVVDGFHYWRDTHIMESGWCNLLIYTMQTSPAVFKPDRPNRTQPVPETLIPPPRAAIGTAAFITALPLTSLQLPSQMPWNIPPSWLSCKPPIRSQEITIIDSSHCPPPLTYLCSANSSPYFTLR